MASAAVYYSSDWTSRCHSAGILRKGLQTAKMKHYEVSSVHETLNLEWRALRSQVLIGWAKSEFYREFTKCKIENNSQMESFKRGL